MGKVLTRTVMGAATVAANPGCLDSRFHPLRKLKTIKPVTGAARIFTYRHQSLQSISSKPRQRKAPHDVPRHYQVSRLPIPPMPNASSRFDPSSWSMASEPNIILRRSTLSMG
ncbi:hypothetical protein Ac2012v2_006729 [Leucoagaricus gongylophorus]